MRSKLDKILEDVKDLLKLFAAEHGHHIRHQDGGDGQEQPAVRPGLRPAAPVSPASPVTRIQGRQLGSGHTFKNVTGLRHAPTRLISGPPSRAKIFSHNHIL